MPLSRKPHWQTKAYNEFLIARAYMPFAWATNDCASFTADGIVAITGVDVMAPLRGYADGAGAMEKILAVTKATTLEGAFEWVATQHGMSEWAKPLLAQRGDLVLYENAGALTAGLVHLNGRDVVSPGEKKLMATPLAAVKRAWRY